MPIFGLMVTKDEGDRYLEHCLDELVKQVDGVAVLDDQSTDNTVGILESHGCEVMVRPDGAPTFLEHEGKFRQLAWEWMEVTFEPSEDDWIVVVDSDQVLVSAQPVGASLIQDAMYAESQGKNGVNLPLAEVWGWDAMGRPMVRTDGWWASTSQPHFCRYQRGGAIADKPIACGSVPTYVHAEGKSTRLHLLHFGYADYEDRQAKYKRYMSLKDHGHNPIHINSIVQQPQLSAWSGPVPATRVYRGGL